MCSVMPIEQKKGLKCTQRAKKCSHDQHQIMMIVFVFSALRGGLGTMDGWMAGFRAGCRARQQRVVTLHLSPTGGRVRLYTSVGVAAHLAARTSRHLNVKSLPAVEVNVFQSLC